MFNEINTSEKNEFHHKNIIFMHELFNIQQKQLASYIQNNTAPN